MDVITTSDRSGRFALLRRSLMQLPPGALDVSCAGGSLWLTLDDDPRDIVLAPGDRFQIDGNRKVLAYALEDSVLEVRERAVQRVRPAVPALAPRAWRLSTA